MEFICSEIEHLPSSSRKVAASRIPLPSRAESRYTRESAAASGDTAAKYGNGNMAHCRSDTAGTFSVSRHRNLQHLSLKPE
ncbi:hypothetical protein AGOR_G00204300 [Albula goreensis]|uniref:Uncharacterized protein n=1 Tax=Albula goreensis TaxID=1534307 RepID=A0A8T3CNQ7_9TELE|nr:hypothetical protein AGOR_G00204300 [Albula goreensis]